MNSVSRQSGNIIMIILIGIVLFAALTYAVTQSMNGGGDFGSSDQADIEATGLLSFANNVATTTQYLVSSGQCTDANLSFQTPLIPAQASYANAASPADGSCKVFASTGGDLTYVPVNRSVFDPAFSSYAASGWDWSITSSRCVKGIGGNSGNCTSASDAELILGLPFVKKEICMKINQKLGIVQSGFDVPEDNYDQARYAGTYTFPASIGNATNGTSLVRQKAGCFKNINVGPASQNSNIFYMVLLAR